MIQKNTAFNRITYHRNRKGNTAFIQVVNCRAVCTFYIWKSRNFTLLRRASEAEKDIVNDDSDRRDKFDTDLWQWVSWWRNPDQSEARVGQPVTNQRPGPDIDTWPMAVTRVRADNWRKSAPGQTGDKSYYCLRPDVNCQTWPWPVNKTGGLCLIFRFMTEYMEFSSSVAEFIRSWQCTLRSE